MTGLVPSLQQAIPSCEDKIWVQISCFPGAIMYLMLGFCLYSQKTKDLVHIVIAYILLIIDSYKSRYPTVAVGWMGLMDFGD